MKMKGKLLAKAAGLTLVAALLGACSFSQVVSGVATVAGVIKGVITIVSWLPPASDLATFDATKTSQYLSLQNMSLTNTSGNVTISISDENTHAPLGSKTFAYQVVNGGQVQFVDPASVTNWVRFFSTYPGYVDVNDQTQFDVTAPPSGQTGAAVSTMFYSGTPLSTSSATVSNGGGGGCSSLAHCVAE